MYIPWEEEVSAETCIGFKFEGTAIRPSVFAQMSSSCSLHLLLIPYYYASLIIKISCSNSQKVVVLKGKIEVNAWLKCKGIWR